MSRRRTPWQTLRSFIGKATGGGSDRQEAAPDRSQELRELLQKKLADLNARAIEAKGEIPAEQLASLERLSKTIRLSEDFEPPPKRWPPALALLVALVLASALLLVRVSETEITLEAEVSELSFELAANKPMIGRLAVSQLGVSGLNSLHVSPDLTEVLAAPQPDGESGPVRLTAVRSNALAAGAINLAAFIPPAGSRAWLQYAGFPRSYRLGLKRPPNGTNFTLRAEANGLLEIAAPGWLDKPQKHDFNKSGATFDFGSGNDIMNVDLELADAAGPPFYAQIPVTNPAFQRIEEFAASDRKTLVETVSTLLGGTLYLESLNSEKHELRAGEQLRFTSATGRLESLELKNDRIVFKFRGRVAGIRVGETETSRNLMPNLLEWLKARQPLSLLWGATLFAYGLIVTVVQWYRNAK